jgi:PAS domain S-box-containing protein
MERIDAPMFLRIGKIGQKHFSVLPLISYTDIYGRIKRINPVFSQITGYHKDEIVGSTFHPVNHPDMPSVIFKYMWSQIRSGKKTEAIILNRSKDGEDLWLMSRVEPSRHKNSGSVYGYTTYQYALPKHIIKNIEPLYTDLINIQNKDGFNASEKHFEKHINMHGTYERFLVELKKKKGGIALAVDKIFRL